MDIFTPCPTVHTVDILWQQVLEHGPRLAGLDVKHHLFELLVIIHGLDSIVQHGSMQLKSQNNHSALSLSHDQI